MSSHVQYRLLGTLFQVQLMLFPEIATAEMSYTYRPNLGTTTWWKTSMDYYRFSGSESMTSTHLSGEIDRPNVEDTMKREPWSKIRRPQTDLFECSQVHEELARVRAKALQSRAAYTNDGEEEVMAEEIDGTLLVHKVRHGVRYDRLVAKSNKSLETLTCVDTAYGWLSYSG